MSGSDPLSGFRRVILGAHALPPGDVQGLQGCKGHYESTGCQKYRSFEVEKTKHLFTVDVRSSEPVTPEDLVPNLGGEVQHHGFLHKEAREIEQHLRNLQGHLQQSFGGRDMAFHLAAMIVAQEWRIFAWSHVVLWDTPDNERKAVLERRRELIRRVTDDRQQLRGMICFSPLVETLKKVDVVLDGVLKQWDVYNAQVRLGGQLRAASAAFDRMILDATEYTVFAFLGLDIGEAFEPKCFIEAENGSKLQEKLKRLASTSFGKMLRTFLLDPSLSAVLGIETSSIAITGGTTAFPKLSEPVQDEQWRELFISLGLEKPPASVTELFRNSQRHGLVEASVCCLDPSDSAKVLEETLKLWEAIRAAAKARQLLHLAADLAHLGGELMLSRQAPKQILDTILRFALETLEAAKQHFQVLQELDHKGSTQISINDSKWGQSKIAMWEQNRKRAKEAGVKLKKNIQDLECLLKEMKESVSTVTSPEVLYEAAQRVKSLCTLSYDVFSEFSQWRTFQLNEAELMVFKPAQLVESTVSCPSERGGSALTGNFKANFAIVDQERNSWKGSRSCRDIKDMVQKAHQDAHETLPEECLPNFLDELLMVWIGSVSAGKSTSINQILMTGVQVTEGQHFCPAEVLPVSSNHCTKIGWYIKKADVGESNTVRAWKYDENGCKVKIEDQSYDDLGDLVHCTETLTHKLNQPYSKSRDTQLGYVEIKLKKETMFTTRVMEERRALDERIKIPVNKQLVWKRPRILEKAILLDPPGINYQLEPAQLADEAMSYVQRVASDRPCVFVWCMPKGHGGLETESKFVLDMVSRAPSCILPVVTKYNESLGSKNSRNHPTTDKHLKNLLDEIERGMSDPDRADEMAGLLQLYESLRENIPSHILAQEMNDFMLKVYEMSPSQRPAAVLGLVDFENPGQELDRALLDAFEKVLQRRVVKDSDVRVVLAELVRLEQNIFNHMAKLMNMKVQGQELCKQVLDEQQDVRAAREKALQTYGEKTRKLLEEVIEKLPGYISEAHDEDKSKTGPLECALWGATGYDNRLLGKVLRRLSEDIAKEAEYRRDALDAVGRATHSWFKGNFGRIVEPPKEVVITLRGKGELGILLENLTDFSELEESLQINEFEVSMFSSVQQCQLENSDWEEADKRKLQSIYSDSNIPDSTTLKIRFASWTPGLKPCRPCHASAEPDGRFFGNPACSITGGLTGMGVGATCIVRFELALLSPASALFAAASLGVAAFIHLQWDPEVQRQELETKLKTTLRDEVGQTWKKEEAHLEKELAKTALRVTQMYVAQRARVEVKQVGTGRQGLMDALEYQRLLSKNKALLQEELQRRMRDELRRADLLLKDPKQQQEARKVMGPPPRFITRDGGPSDALLVNPHRVMTHDGRSAVVSEVRARHAYETSVFRPTECHVAKFLLEEWLHEALLKMENSARSLNPAPSNAPTDVQLQAQAAQDRAWDHLFGAGCGR